MVTSICAPVFRRRGVPAAEADDLLQDVRVSVWEYAREREQEPRNLSEFLKWRARGVFSKYWREKRRMGLLSDMSMDTAAELGTESGPRTPPDALLLEELSQALQRCVEALDQRLRIVWCARYERGLDTQEVSSATGIGYATVCVHLHRAKKALIACLERKKVLA